MRQIRHDAFARTTLMSEVVKDVAGGCTWCGQYSPKGNLFRYGTMPDDSGRLNWHKGLFCSIGCHDTYHS